MSFIDKKNYIDQRIIEPWNAFRQKSMQLNQIHNDCLNQFAQAMGDLLAGSDGEPAFQGPSAESLAKMVGDFLDGERKLSGASADPAAQIGLQPDLAAACEKWARALEQKVGDIATQPVVLENFAMGATMVVGAGGVAQGGLDIPWDVFALLLVFAVVATFRVSPIDMHDGFRIKTQAEVADEVRADAAGQAMNDDIRSFDSEATNAQNNNPLPPLPPDPQADPNAFLKAMGLAAGAAGLIAAGATIIWNLTADQEDIAQRIKHDFGTVSIDDIREIIGNNPGLDEAQYRLLVEYFRRTGSKPYGVLSIVGVSKEGSRRPWIIFITKGDIQHIRDEHPDDFSSMSDQQLADFLTGLMDGKADRSSTDGTSTRYEFDNAIKVNNEMETVAVNVSNVNPGKIMTSFIPGKKKTRGR